MAYQLYYWPMLQGRGEFVRLALEDAGAEYVDVARNGNGKGMEEMQALLESDVLPELPFAPPFLKDGETLISQTANILHYLGPILSLAPRTGPASFQIQGLQLTIADAVAEAHDTHHPLASSAYYEDQKDAAKVRAADFIDQRIPKFLGYFERVLERNPHGQGWLVGGSASYADLSLFQLVEGLHYAFPRGMRGFDERYSRVAQLRHQVLARENIAAYLKSARRIAFNEEGIFRHYAELDREPKKAS